MSTKLGALQRHILSTLLSDLRGIGAYSTKDLILETGAQQKSINRALNGLVEQGYVTRESGRQKGELRWCYLYRAKTPKKDMHAWRQDALHAASRYAASLNIDNQEEKYQLEQAVSYLILNHPHLFETVSTIIQKRAREV